MEWSGAVEGERVSFVAGSAERRKARLSAVGWVGVELLLHRKRPSSCHDDIGLAGGPGPTLDPTGTDMTNKT